MLKKLSTPLLLGITFISGSISAQTTTDSTIPSKTTITPQISTTSGIEQRMNQALQKAEDEVQTQFTNATRRDVVPRWDDKVQLENAIIQLEVKKTLVNNFKGTKTLESPVIQAKLLELLNKSIITESDLADLQNLTTQEKLKQNVIKPQDNK